LKVPQGDVEHVQSTPAFVLSLLTVAAIDVAMLISREVGGAVVIAIAVVDAVTVTLAVAVTEDITVASTVIVTVPGVDGAV
jgi:hypothetical protein